MILVCIPCSDSNRRMRACCKQEHHYMRRIAAETVVSFLRFIINYPLLGMNVITNFHL